MKISICLILILSYNILAQEINEISVGDYLELSYDPNSGKNAFYYKVTLKELDIQNDTEIGVFVRPLDYKSDPDVFISTINQYPSTDDSEIECSLYGFDVCYFPEKYLKANQTFYLAVNCENTCKFSLQVDLKKTILINFNTTKLVKLASKSEHIYHLNIPNITDLEHFRVLFTFYGITSREPTIWIVKGNAPSSTNWNQDSLPVFYAPFGNIFIASKEQFPKGFCIDCNYTISIEVEDETMLKITSLPGEQIENISLWQEVNDGVVIDGRQVYILDTIKNVHENEHIEWNDKDRINDTLVFEMSVYEGNPDLYISCDSMPEDLSQFFWSSNFWKSEALIIGPDDFAKLLPGSCKKIYIVVYGKRWSVYKLLVKRVTKQNVNTIKAGEYEVGILEQGHIQNFIMTINREEIEKNTVVVTDLTALRGNPDLYIKGCENLQNCTITEEDLVKADQFANNESMFFLYSTNQESFSLLINIKKVSIMNSY